ncbi:radical SAM protein [Desulfovibrio inopinatus]|uniref:radical SAM protein n=1 Tax=Desulfovibrio inopinatus TaxID=102109 RepID=UPI0004034985|nr:radical SAM protein [Desulfovibrio inopinatus]
MSRQLHISQLRSGGIMTTMACSSRCRHCLYACGPEWPREFIAEDTLRHVVKTCLQLRCRSVHIGGGEPFLNPEHLIMVARVCREMGLGIDYIETNASWFASMDQAIRFLTTLQQAGVGTLLVSISPFHNEFIPFHKTKGVLAACRKTGMGIFPWVMDFYSDLDALEHDRPHRLAEYEHRLGPNYLAGTLSRYWIHFGGRALNTFRSYLPAKSFVEILTQSGPCSELEQTSHFHFDPWGDYIPGLCSHLRIPRPDSDRAIDARHAEWIDTLYSVGVVGLVQQLPDDVRDSLQQRTYLSKCDLCEAIFSWKSQASSVSP